MRKGSYCMKSLKTEPIKKAFNPDDYDKCIHEVKTIKAFSENMEDIKKDVQGNYNITKAMLMAKIRLSDFNFDYDMKFNVIPYDEKETESTLSWGLGFRFTRNRDMDTNSYLITAYFICDDDQMLECEICNTELINLSYDENAIVLGDYESNGTRSNYPTVIIDCSKNIRIIMNNMPFGLENLFGEKPVKNLFKIKQYSFVNTN